MATLTQSNLSLLELAKRIDPNGQVASIAEVLQTTKNLFAYLPWKEANMETAHRGTVRTSLPTGTWRQLNKGVSSESSTTKQITEYLGMLETYSEIDVKEARMSGNVNQYRNTEDKAFIEGLAQTFMSTFFYGNNATNTGSFTGLHPRYATLTAGSVVTGGGSTARSSIWILQPGENKMEMLYPKGMGSGGAANFGVVSTDLREDTKTLSDGTMYQVYRTHFEINAGMFVKDERCVKRIANIDTSDLSALIATEKIDDIMIELINEMPMAGQGAVIVVNKKVKTAIDIYAKDKSNVNYDFRDFAGQRTTFFQESPIIVEEAILNNEPAIA